MSNISQGNIIKKKKKKSLLHIDFSIHISAVVSRKQTRRTSFAVGYHGYVAWGIPAFQHGHT